METIEKQTVAIQLNGVESEHCALIVDSVLDKVPGVKAHKVELNNHRAVVTEEDAQENLPKAVFVIQGLGYHVKTLKQAFPVSGMSYASCATVPKALLWLNLVS